MYSIALVQNQSEMAHYGYADARPLLDGYDYRLFTGDNVAELPVVLARRQVDAVVLGSNALNDKVILRTLCNPGFASQLGEFLASGRGLLCLQQIGLAMRKGPALNLLPEPLGQVVPTVLAREDTALSGRLAVGSGAARHVALTYPQLIDPAEVRAHACSFPSLPGVYWHYWERVDLAEWDQLIVDPSASAERALVLAAKQSAPWRVVISSLPLDWQKHVSLFRNLLTYATEGRHNVATLTDRRVGGPFDYLRESLVVQRLPFGEYVLPDDTERLARNVRHGIHSTLLIAPRLHLRDLPDPLQQTVETAVQGGTLRVLDIGPGAYGISGVNVVSRELRPRRLLQGTELQVQGELRTGYIDDSFWSHIETLQTLDKLPDRTVDYAGLLEPAWAITRNHDREGSYDEIFGPTCAYYWFRARYLGVDSAEARQTAGWLRGALPRYESHERALAYLMFASHGQLLPEEEGELARIVRALDVTRLSETDLVLYLRAALVLTGRPELTTDPVTELALALAGRQRNGAWVDLTTTATAANLLLDARAALAGDGARAADVRRQIEDSAQDAIVVILRVLAQSEAAPGSRPYPWDGKASTTVKCLQAWMKFDALQDLPVYDILENLRRSDERATQFASNRTALAVLGETNAENIRLRVELATAVEREGRATGRLEQAERRGRVRDRVLLAAAAVMYVLSTMLVGLLASKERSASAAALDGFVKGWGFHLAFLSFVVSLAGIYAARRGKDGKRDDTDAPDHG
jgi:hypothetical protein